MKKILILSAIFMVLMLSSCDELLKNQIKVLNKCDGEIKVGISRTSTITTSKYIQVDELATFFGLSEGSYFVTIERGDDSATQASSTVPKTYNNIYISKESTWVVTQEGSSFKLTR